MLNHTVWEVLARGCTYWRATALTVPVLSIPVQTIRAALHLCAPLAVEVHTHMLSAGLAVLDDVASFPHTTSSRVNNAAELTLVDSHLLIYEHMCATHIPPPPLPSLVYTATCKKCTHTTDYYKSLKISTYYYMDKEEKQMLNLSMPLWP